MEQPKKQAATSKKKSSTGLNTGKSKNRRPRSKRGGTAASEAQSIRKTRTYPTMRETVHLDHAIVRGCFERHFDGFRSAFFNTTSILGKFGLETGCEQVHEYIVGLIDRAKVEVDAATAEIAVAIKKNGGPQTIPRTAPDPTQKSAEVPGFVVRKYLSLFPAVDRLIDAIVCAESFGAIPWSRRAELLRDAPAYLRSPAGRFTSISTKLSARQNASQDGLSVATKAMESLLKELLQSHSELKGVEQKRSLVRKKTGTEG